MVLWKRSQMPLLCGLLTLVVQFQEPLEHFSASYLGNSESKPLLGFMESMSKINIIPAIGLCYCIVHFDMHTLNGFGPL